jgi:hypothetical protein
MRTMEKDGIEIHIKEHIILKNLWEYYVTDDVPIEGEPDIVQALVVGFETELGDVSLSEIKPYIISRTKSLNEVLPAPNWNWKE